jgi:radical SAM superfamily enzyme with C-terminal helix-hairpin-helix motif
VGGIREPWGLPHLLPGINLLYGLPGESKKTLDNNMDFLKQILDEGLMVRRINVRQVISLPGTGLKQDSGKRIKRNQFFKHREAIRNKIDFEMIQRVAPYGTLIKSVFIDGQTGNSYLLRPLGTYPLLCHMPQGAESVPKDVFVVDHGPRSLTVLPYPFNVKRASLAQWKKVPGIGAKRAVRTKTDEVIENVEHLQSTLDMELPDWFLRTLDFR